MSAYNTEFRAENGMLHIRLSGTFPNELLQRAENLFQPVIDACATHQCTRALIDAREVEIAFGTLAVFRAGEDAVALKRGGLRVALLARRESVDPLFNTVVTNRGGEVGIFTDVDAARRWVEGRSPAAVE